MICAAGVRMIMSLRSLGITSMTLAQAVKKARALWGANGIAYFVAPNWYMVGVITHNARDNSFTARGMGHSFDEAFKAAAHAQTLTEQLRRAQDEQLERIKSNDKADETTGHPDNPGDESSN